MKREKEREGEKKLMGKKETGRERKREGKSLG